MIKRPQTRQDNHLEKAEHYPVMLPEVLESLNIKGGGVYVDCTFGRGGYTRAILQAGVSDRSLQQNEESNEQKESQDLSVKVIALDRDDTAAKEAEKVYSDYPSSFRFSRCCFDTLDKAIKENHETGFIPTPLVDGIVFDLGVSSPQLDQAERGFSFRFDGPLDMRMSREGPTAADVVNTYKEEELANLIYKYGEEKKSRLVAKAIVMDRQKKPFETTAELAGLLRRIIPRSKDGIDPATRTFQALRIHVNDELGQLERALENSLEVLAPGGRLVVVSFHSLEDRIVKTFFAEKGKKQARNKYRMDHDPDAEFPLTILTKKACLPSKDEIRDNPRSRSAKLRVAEKKQSPEVVSDNKASKDKVNGGKDV